MAGTRVEEHLRADSGRRRPGRGALPATLGLVLVLAGLVGLGSGRPLWRIGGPPELLSTRSYTGDLMLIVFGLLVVSPLIISAIRRRRRRGGAPEDTPDLPPVKIPWWGRVITFAVLLVAILVALLVIRMLPGSGSDGGGLRVLPRPPAAGQSLPPVKPSPPPVHWWGYAGLALVLLAGAVAYWRLRRTEPNVRRAEPEPDDNAELLEALDLSLDDLETDPDARRAVIRAYARMERALGANGLVRAPSETALEYLARALASLRVGRPSVTQLTALYERAKFSSHEIDGSMKADAIAALSSLREELATLRDEPTGAAA